MTTYNLQSTSLIHTPGVVAWAQNGYHFKKDRARLERIFTDGYKLPVDAVRALLSGKAPATVTDDVVTFTYEG